MSQTISDANARLVRVSVIKAEGQTDLQAVASNAAEAEDDFRNMYGEDIICPPYNPLRLAQLTFENNALLQCISAMEVNIDGTGFDFVRKDGKKVEKDPTAQTLLDFFADPYPDQSFISQRRQLRWDIEATGNGYLEVIRNPAGEIMLLRPITSIMMRLCRLGDPVLTEKTMMRGGKEQKIKVWVRERAFVQLINNRKVFFKEFGSSRDIHRDSGAWSKVKERLPAPVRGTEILHFTCIRDITTPYGVPRWITQAPSVMGSRKAEELNLDFFDSGGVPPIMMLLSGGIMGDEVRKQLENMLAGKAKDRQRAAVIEVVPTGGSLEKDGKAELKIERFGSERQQDSMFEKYDDKCERRIRSSFRLPPLFVGKAEDYSFATAFASYSVAEAQVFQPERTEFDEIITKTLLKEMNAEYEMRSLPLTIKDIEVQLKGLDTVAAKGAIDAKGLIDAVNEITGLSLTYVKPEEPASIEPEVVLIDAEGNRVKQPEFSKPVEPKEPVKEPVTKQDIVMLIDLVDDFMRLSTKEPHHAETVKLAVKSLGLEDRRVFDGLMAARLFPHSAQDITDLEQLCGCAVGMTLDGD